MSHHWIRLAARPSSAAMRPGLSNAIFATGADGIHEDGDWLVVYFSPASDIAHVESALRLADPAVTVETREAPATDWSAGWRVGMRAHVAGRITVAPPWLASESDPATTVLIEPGMAFGTGDHATTRGVIRLLQDVVRNGDMVADLGSGSGVLSIAAAKLGAGRVAAIELDGDAMPNAEENVALNGVARIVTVLEGDATVLLPLIAPVRVIVANIVSSVLLELLPVIDRSLTADGVAILSGILTDERSRMTWLLELKGWRILNEDREDVWWSVCIAK